MPHTKASFSHRLLSLVERCLARKLHFHIFHFQILKDVPHESFVFTSSTITCGEMSRTKSSFSHLPLSLLEGSLARKLRFPIFRFQILRQICAARSSIVFCNSVSADRIVMAASRLLGAAAVSVVYCFLAARHRKSYWSCCIMAAIAICQQVFSILAVVIFLLKIFLKSASKSSLFLLWRRDPSGFGAAISGAVARNYIVFCDSVFAHRIVMAASRLLGAAAAYVILSSFAAGHRKSYWSGCIKAVIVIC